MQLSLNTTVYRKERREEKNRILCFAPAGDRENELINLYPEVRYQSFEGFGGALTDAAGYVYGHMSAGDRKKLIQAYFGKDGMQYNRVRLPIDSCDFSVEQFQAVSGKEDQKFETFSLDREKQYIYPLWEDIREVVQNIEVMVTPWSPPDFMKTNKRRVQGGHLKEEYRASYAEYLCRYIEELRKTGVPVSRMSVQNEPKAVQAWDSCLMDGQEEKIFLRDYLYPAMEKHGLADVEIFIWDHNKERVWERANEVIDETTAHMVKGIAFHWYSGDHFEALRMVRDRFPDLKLILSEACIEYGKFSADNEYANARKYAHEIIGNLNVGMNAFYDWNLLLDEQGGPNYAANFCDAPYMYHRGRQELRERTSLSVIGHFSKYIRPGAVRIGQSSYTDQLETTAFINSDGSIAVVVFNRTEEVVPVTLRIGGECVSWAAEPDTLSTGIITE
ncbi:MAG: glucosylceramidase [Clostridiales bacterium]|nr:glucosylceramidase [Clostridiales bacterium]